MSELTLTEPTTSDNCISEVSKLLLKEQSEDYLLISKEQEKFLNKIVDVCSYNTMEICEDFLYCEMERRQLTLSIEDCELIINHSQSKKINDYLKSLILFKKQLKSK